MLISNLLLWIAAAIATALILAYARSHRGRVAILRAHYAEARERFLAWRAANPAAPETATARSDMFRASGEYNAAVFFRRMPVAAEEEVPSPQYSPNPAPPMPPIPPPPAPVAPAPVAPAPAPPMPPLPIP